MSTCGVVPQPQQLISQLIGYFDCQAHALATYGFAGLAAPGGLGATLLLMAITITIALFGYRLMIAGAPAPAFAADLFVRLAVVLALATGFAAFNQLFVGVILRGPSEVGQQIIASAALIDQPDALASRLDLVDQGFRSFGYYGAGGVAADDPSAFFEPSPWAGFDNFAIGMARVLFVVTAMMAASLPKVFAGILLASAPLFLLFLLFDRGIWLVAGWLRMLAASAVATMSGLLILAMEAQLLSIWLADLVARRTAEQAAIGAPAALFAVAVAFMILTILSISWSARLVSIVAGSNMNSSDWLRTGNQRSVRSTVQQTEAPRAALTSETVSQPDRAQQIANAAMGQLRREAMDMPGKTGGSPGGANDRRSGDGFGQPGFGYASVYASRRAVLRRSAASQRRGALR